MPREDSAKYAHLKHYYNHNDGDRWLPLIMKNQPRWCTFRYSDPNPKHGGKRTKMPCNDDGFPISMKKTDQLSEYTTDRTGYLLQADNRIVIVDFDGRWLTKHREWCLDFIERASGVTYVERSLGNELDGKDSVHIVGLGELPIISTDSNGNPKTAQSCSDLDVEIYDRDRFFVMTGLGNKKAIQDFQPLLEELFAKVKEVTATPLDQAISNKGYVNGASNADGVNANSQHIPAETPNRKKTMLRHGETDRLVAQFKEMLDKNLRFLPSDRKSWLGYLQGFKTIGMTSDEIIDLCRRHPGWDEKTDPDTIRNTGIGTFDPEKQLRVFFKNNKENGYVPKKPEPKSPTKHFIHTTHMPNQDYKACLKEMGIKYRDNTFRGVQVSYDNGVTWEGNSSGLHANVYDQIQQHCSILTEKGFRPANFVAVNRKEVLDALLYQNKFNPILDYLNSLTPREDRKVEMLLGQMFGLDIAQEVGGGFSREQEQRYAADILMLNIKGIVLRQLYPGCEFSFFTIIVGRWGSGKSLMIREILPPDIRQGAFTNSFDMALPHKEKELVLRSAAVVECAELMGHSRRAVAEHKSLVSGTQAIVRIAYEKYPEEILRNAIMIATTNEIECLPIDPDGDRRNIILPVAPKFPDDEIGDMLIGLMDQNRDRLFAHALWLIKEQKEIASYKHWSPSSRQLRLALIARSEKRNYHLEEAISSLIYDERAYVIGRREDANVGKFREGQEVPLSLPSKANAPTIMGELKLLTQNNKAISSDLRAQYVANILQRMGWEHKGRKRITVNGVSYHATFYQVPKYRQYIDYRVDEGDKGGKGD